VNILPDQKEKRGEGEEKRRVDPSTPLLRLRGTQKKVKRKGK